MPVDIVETDFEPPNPWLGYLECLRDPPDGATHMLVVQDDTVTCRNVTPALHLIAGKHPNTPICVFLGKLPMRTRKAALEAGKAGEHYVTIHHGDFLPVVAVLWPVDKAVEFYDWGLNNGSTRHKNGRPLLERSDDAMGGRWMRQKHVPILATIPSLIEHPDDVASTIARKPAGRTALFWHGQDWDALEVDWVL